MKPLFAHIIEPNNTGDFNCSPKNFFSHWCQNEEADYHDVSIRDRTPLIVGGGGMLHPGIDAWVSQISRVRPVIVWGIGLNYHQAKPPLGWEDYLVHCKLVGLRDYPPLTGKFEWAPCSTCMSSAFDTDPDEPEPTEDAVIYEHWQVPVEKSGFDRFSNHRNDTPTIQAFVETVRRYRYVITNSFHGALWTLYSGRVPIVWRPMALRFKTALPPGLLVATNGEEIEPLLKTVPRVHNPLHEHRAATMKFYNLVESYLARWGCE